VYTLPVPGCDGKTAAEIFEAAGCVTPAAPSCAACLGGPRDTFARMNEPEVRWREVPPPSPIPLGQDGGAGLLPSGSEGKAKGPVRAPCGSREQVCKLSQLVNDGLVER
jgi:hypothetical protein